MLNFGKIQEILGKESDSLLGFKNPKVSKDQLHLPGPDFVDRIFRDSDRSPKVLRSLQAMYGAG
ncbi:MAG: class I fructose-bisphosphate aldolase, partial [Bdellovibrionota bacterium]